MAGSFATAIAHNLGLFRLLHERTHTAETLAAALGLSWRRLEPLVIVCVAAGLVRRTHQDYTLTEVAEDYLVESSPTYAGYLFELFGDENAPLSYQRLYQGVVSDVRHARGQRPWIEAHRHDEERAASFTRLMHGHSMGAAHAWPERIDLGAFRRMLDIGGGSGAHAIGAVLQWPQLEALVLDLPSVCKAAGEYIGQYGLHNHIRTHAADMWLDPFPEADLHFYSDVLHDWTPEEGIELIRKSHAHLPHGGGIILHEMLYDDDKRGPFTVAASSLSMLAWCGGQQYSGQELTAMLDGAGFTDVAVVRTFGYWSIVSGRKR